MRLGQKRPNIASETLRKSACKAMELNDHRNTVTSHESKKNQEHFSLCFYIPSILFMLSSFKILGFECSQSPGEKLTSYLS